MTSAAHEAPVSPECYGRVTCDTPGLAALRRAIVSPSADIYRRRSYFTRVARASHPLRPRGAESTLISPRPAGDALPAHAPQLQIVSLLKRKILLHPPVPLSLSHTHTLPSFRQRSMEIDGSSRKHSSLVNFHSSQLSRQKTFTAFPCLFIFNVKVIKFQIK